MIVIICPKQIWWQWKLFLPQSLIQLASKIMPSLWHYTVVILWQFRIEFDKAFIILDLSIWLPWKSQCIGEFKASEVTFVHAHKQLLLSKFINSITKSLESYNWILCFYFFKNKVSRCFVTRDCQPWLQTQMHSLPPVGLKMQTLSCMHEQ